MTPDAWAHPLARFDTAAEMRLIADAAAELALLALAVAADSLAPEWPTGGESS